ncbi:hypothetical protein AJ79_06775 [Helicocarpus griseus UAMH5409]|uniref:Oxidoreductase n=1 Tax=Helicocarpus griseus UAMH5409 TaxID=1447875 RepID=A0A2B7XAD2_9EURO|nr:hypothetical protein AJ79_06775 [Helicocarpus griseus UAMH5409]
MPLPLLSHTLYKGVSSVPYAVEALKTAPWIALVLLLKRYFGGARNKSERLMHSKVVMMTGGTSGIGASIARSLASQGAQIILLTQHVPSDPFLVDYIEDLRKTTDNQLIYAEQVDLSSLHSIRTFATRWVDNAPPRRLDMVILCANTLKPSHAQPRTTIDSLDEEWQVNYLANYHLLSILSPALRAQPPDRDVRVIFSTCSSYIGAQLDIKTLGERTMRTATSKSTSSSNPNKQSKRPSKLPTIVTPKPSKANMYATSKLALMVFAKSFQSHLSNYARPDKQPCNTRVLLVDPGFSRTPGTRRWLTGGSLLGLLFYLITWPIWWLILKSSEQGSQSFLTAAMEAGFAAHAANIGGVGAGLGVAGGKVIKECKEWDVLRKEIMDEQIGKELWEFSSKQIEQREKEGAVLRALEKKEREAWEKEQEKKEGDGAAASSSGAGEELGRGTKQQTPGSRRSKKGK